MSVYGRVILCSCHKPSYTSKITVLGEVFQIDTSENTAFSIKFDQ